MSVYEVTLEDGSVYEVETEDAAIERPLGGRISGRPASLVGAFTKGAYKAIPSTIREKMESSMGVWKALGESLESIKPHDIPAQVVQGLGNLAVTFPLMNPFMKAGQAIKFLPNLLKLAAGAGLYGGTRAGIEKQPIIPSALENATSMGLAGLVGKVGATVVPSVIPAAERIGSALGMGGLAFLGAPEEEKASEAILQGVIGAKYPFRAGIMSKETKQEVASRLVNSLIKPLKKQFSYGKNPGRGVAREKIVANNFNELSEKVSAKRQELGKMINDRLSQPDAMGKRLSIAEEINKPFDNAINEAIKGGKENVALTRRLQNTREALISEMALSPEGEIVTVSTKDLTSLTPLEASRIKTKIGDMTKWTGNPSDDAIVNRTLQEAYRGIKEKIGTTVSDIRVLNERYADITSADIAIKYRDQIRQRQNLISLDAKLSTILGYGISGGKIGGALTGYAIYRALASTAVKTRVAKWLMQSSLVERKSMFERYPDLRDKLNQSFSKARGLLNKINEDLGGKGRRKEKVNQ